MPNAPDIVQLRERRLHIGRRQDPRSFTMGILFLNVDDITAFLVPRIRGHTPIQRCRFRNRGRFVNFRRFDLVIVNLKVAV